jgi:hypothetical protein
MVLLNCQTWIEGIIFIHHGSMYPWLTGLPKLKSLDFGDLFFHKSEISKWLSVCCNTIQSIKSKHDKTSKNVFTILLNAEKKFPNLMELLAEDWSSVSIWSFKQFPLLMYGMDEKSHPSYVLNGNYFEGSYKSINFTSKVLMLCNRYKYKAIFTFLLIIQRSFPKDLQRFFAKIILEFPGDFWFDCVTNKDYNIPNDATVLLLPELEKLHNDKQCFKNRIDHTKSVIERHNEQLSEYNLKYKEIQTKIKEKNEEILTIKKRKL